MRLIPGIIVILAIVFISCSEGKKDPAQKDVLQGNNSEYPAIEGDFKFNLDSNELKKSNSSGLDDAEFKLGIEATAPEMLLKVLPQQIQGYETIPGNYGGSGEGKERFTSASLEYIGNAGGYINIAIYDYPKKSLNPFVDNFFSLPEMTGFMVGRVPINNGIAFREWNESSRSGKFHALLDDRFYIQISVKTIPAQTPMPESIYKLINTGKLINSKK